MRDWEEHLNADQLKELNELFLFLLFHVKRILKTQLFRAVLEFGCCAKA